ncbi:hypothetical protein ANCCAN_24442 [Ancylostoma caninum]|uniref:Uncharacterized protein n=1 Tax=Ancylostoma caninum TaxID=29170 RepID=A0A368FCA6_ANCCA|nr:hypothetical protein ANCCAN_24442 [Ancylostoma caninum]
MPVIGSAKKLKKLKSVTGSSGSPKKKKLKKFSKTQKKDNVDNEVVTTSKAESFSSESAGDSDDEPSISDKDNVINAAKTKSAKAKHLQDLQK